MCVQSVISIVSTTSRKHNVLTAARECSRGLPHLATQLLCAQSNEIAAFHAYTSHCRRTRRIAHTCFVLAEIRCAQINQGNENLQGSWCAHPRHESKKEGDDLHPKPRIVFCISRNTSILVYLSHAAVTHNGVNSLDSLPRPQSCSRDIEDGLQGGRWVAAQKPHNSTWQGKPACWG